ncbi:PLP-dependent aminotransferase family protein [Bacillus sp. CECT 9360]|uniref:MocR-like pyridoxine biosynthesis transcription factor PdxR n=1 Tax=Bacillus sp. CECT 9360 TaxID=2845821 RepID=UPI001E3D8F0F|nr:PLP-dependent aminotransferase family protein [Bacillus sp. CECT 9360]CAH0344727.1 HTH-type transcriptional regulatory protein GabR [Bacillus sp. CECT 9360]
MFEITPDLDRSNSTPLYMQLYEYIKKEIQSGGISAGTKLPSKRKLSNHLEISQNTVEAAYQQLNAEGYVEAKSRKGIFVNKLEEDAIFFQSPETQYIKEKNDEKKYKIDFNHGKVDLDHFPFSIWRKLTQQSLYFEERELFLSGDSQGEVLLREEIAKYLFQSRGVRCARDQVIIGAGTQYLIGLLCLVIGKEPIYSMEDPGFHRIRTVLEDQGVGLKHIPLDEEGISIRHLKDSNARIVYVTPSHQFPNGNVMPITRRMELLKWAEEKNGYIIEDDYDGEFRHVGKPIPSLQGLDAHGRVIYLGTFSKSLIPSIRISYMILPPDLARKYHEKFQLYKQTVSRLNQNTLYQFMLDGHWERHLNKMRNIYRRKHTVLLSAIEKNFNNQVTIIGDKSGLHILLEVHNNMSEDELIRTAAMKDIRVYPTTIYQQNKDNIQHPKILLGYGGLTELQIDEGIGLLKKAWFI